MPELPENSKTQFLPLVVLISITLLAAVLRFLAAQNDLWIDELIFLPIARQARQISDIFTVFNYDNNHFLNTLWMYAIGPNQPMLAYRVPAIVYGILSVPAMYWATVGFSARARLLATLRVAINYPLIHFSSEARGYSGALLASILAYGIAV